MAAVIRTTTTIHEGATIHKIVTRRGKNCSVVDEYAIIRLADPPYYVVTSQGINDLRRLDRKIAPEHRVRVIGKLIPFESGVSSHAGIRTDRPSMLS